MISTTRPDKPAMPVFRGSVVVEEPKVVPAPRVSVENPVFSSGKR
ncbi:hypothetical protein [Actinokineospora diospyrosa]|uniref:Uncharacterized protein n=1 Tax=Actinokineospora diospyrosa TaxID=103728 RepID=A0ABT1IHG1_9PSEU|nr:hypothetical protein [Actinokineospora diospyrosa]MCP2272081.1 hypothetical protein [Actinokineospora diospyrosa]